MIERNQGTVFSAIGKLLLPLFNLYYFLFFTEAIGFRIGGESGFIVSPPVVVLLAIDGLIVLLVLLSEMKIRIKVASAAFIFLLWTLMVTGFRHSLSTYLLPMLGLITMWIPIIVKLPISEATRQLAAAKWFCRGLALSFVFAYQDLISYLFSLPKTEELIPFIAEGAQRTGKLFGVSAASINLVRINSLMAEPAWYAIYLPLGYICINSLEQRKLISKRKAIFFKLHIIAFLTLTFSLSGLAVFIGYLIISQALFIYRKGFDLPFKAIASGIAITLVTVVLLSQVSDFNTAVGSVLDRISVLPEQVGSLQDKNLATSAGSRVHSFTVAIDSIDSSNKFMGEGLGATDDWLKANFSRTNYFGQGNMFNNYGAILIAVGPLGFLFYLLFIFTSIENRARFPNIINSTYFCVWLILGCTMGSVLYYHYWGSLYLISTRGRRN
jgi:hypothetical protein